MGVSAGHQRRGLGRFLLHGLLDIATRSGMDDVTLEVRVSNAVARALYGAFGFHETGLRKAYYRDTGEDAIIMSTERLGGSPMRQRIRAIRDRIADDFPGAEPVVSDTGFESWLSPRG
jgi:ribosomal-protein-alanine N-acetyltransferase